jgi:hypothetical protein
MGLDGSLSTDLFILPDLLFVGALWVWASSNFETTSESGVCVCCVIAVDV